MKCSIGNPLPSKDEDSEVKTSAVAKKRDSASKSRSKSPPKRKNRSRSRSRSRQRSSRRRNSRSGSRDNNGDDYSRRRSGGGDSEGFNDAEGYRLHVADLDPDADKRDLERIFGKYGPLKEIWMARSIPCFAFIVFRYREDAEDAQRKADGIEVCGRRMRVTIARPRTRNRTSMDRRDDRRDSFDRDRRSFDTSNSKCYQCGERGHFSRDCPDTKYGYKRPPSPSAERKKSRSNY